MPFIELTNISKHYNKGKPNVVHALKNISLTIEEGEMVAIMGPSGSGKSTLLHILGALDNYDGEYLYQNKKIHIFNQVKLAKFRNENIGFVLQEYGLLHNKSAFENIALPLYFNNTQISTIPSKVKEIMEILNIDELFKRKVKQLSGGQKQRVAIARALVNEPKIILADEPTGALDTMTAKEIIRVLQAVNATGKTVIIVTHNDEVASMCKRIVRLRDGEFI